MFTHDLHKNKNSWIWQIISNIHYKSITIVVEQYRYLIKNISNKILLNIKPLKDLDKTAQKYRKGIS